MILLNDKKKKFLWHSKGWGKQLFIWQKAVMGSGWQVLFWRCIWHNYLRLRGICYCKLERWCAIPSMPFMIVVTGSLSFHLSDFKGTILFYSFSEMLVLSGTSSVRHLNIHQDCFSICQSKPFLLLYVFCMHVLIIHCFKVLKTENLGSGGRKKEKSYRRLGLVCLMHRIVVNTLVSLSGT